MKTVEVSTGEKYNIVIADGILEKCGEMKRGNLGKNGGDCDRQRC